MSEAAKTARNAMKKKAERLTSTDPHEKVDSSTWTPPEPENAGVKTGARPLVKRLYKKGGKVVGKAEGAKAQFRADRKPRKSGGKADHKAPWLDDLINRDVRMANDVREGVKHVGGFKKGGKIHKLGGGTLGDNPVSMQDRSLAKASGMVMSKGGVAKHKHREHHDGSEGNVAGAQTQTPDYDTAMKNAAAAIARSKATMTGSDAQRAANAAAYDRQQEAYQRSLPQNRKHGGKTDGHKVDWLKRATGGDVERAVSKMTRSSMYPRGTQHPSDTMEPGMQKLMGAKSGVKTMNELMKRTGKQPDFASFSKETKEKTGRKHGGKTSHPDEAEDKKLMHKVLKKDAFKDRAHKVSGGRLGDYIQSASWDLAAKGTNRGVNERKEKNRLRGIRTAVNKLGGGYSKNAAMVPAGKNESMGKYSDDGPTMSKKEAIDQMIAKMHQRMDERGYAPGSMKRGMTPGRAAAMATGSEDQRIKLDQPNLMYGKAAGGKAMHHEDCSCKMCMGGRMGKYSGGGTFSGNSKEKIPGAIGGRHAHAAGGKAGKGKTNINIIIGGRGQPQGPMGLMGGAPLPNAPVSPRTPMPGMPPQGMPPMGPGGMPPMGPQGMPPMPPQGMPMGRKSGGRAYPIDTGAGGANARLEKIDAYGLKPPKGLK